MRPPSPFDLTTKVRHISFFQSITPTLGFSVGHSAKTRPHAPSEAVSAPAKRGTCADCVALPATPPPEMVKTTNGSRFNQTAANGVTDKTRNFVDLEFLHDVSPVRLSSFHTDVQQAGHFLCALPFRNQLQDLRLPGA